MSTLFLVRHGETVWHTGKRYAGVTDIGLTPLGVLQAEDLARWAGGARLDAVWSSPLSRCRDTAEPAARSAGVGLHVDDDLLELDFGRAEGRTLEEVEEEDPKAAAAFRDDPAAHPLPGGEDPQRAAARGDAALRRIAAAGQDDRVLVVWHGTLMRLVLCRMLGIPEGEYRRVFPEVRNGALTELELDGPQPRLHTLNAPLP